MANINQKLWLAVGNGNTDEVVSCLQRGADINYKGSSGWTPLQKAAANGHDRIVEVLVEGGGDVNAHANSGLTALHYAALGGHDRIVEILVEGGGDVNVQNVEGKTALHWAALRGHDRSVEILVEGGGEVNVQDRWGRTALYHAAQWGHDRIVEVLVEGGGEVNVQNVQGQTALHVAAGYGRDRSVEILVEEGGDVNVQDREGYTALHWAAQGGHDRIVEVLVEGGGDINVQDILGSTPLHDAVQREETKTAAILVQAGCDKSILNKKGKSPFDYASDEFKEEFEVLVSQSKATKAFTFPKMNDVTEFGKLMSKGTYSSFTNIVYLGGACNVGKSTLASILMGKAIPLTWHSTDGLHIFFGCFGIELETREMIPVSTVPGNSEILATVLLGQPGVEAPTSAEPEISISSQDKVKDEKKSEGLSTLQRGVKRKSQDTKTSPIKIKKILPAKSYTTIRDDIKEELKKGTYKVKIAPSDLVDFGGQLSFDMTHQLFIRQKGVFVLMLDGRKNLHDRLEEYPQGEITTASILLHWVTSILTYCGVEDDDILPLIIFVATHSDCFPEEKQLESRKLELTQEITALFDKHEHRQRILYDSLYFINGMDKSDVGISNLKAKLVDVAFEQKSWGQKMPMAWVPLELQISEMRADGINLVSTEELSNLNAANDEMALSEKQLEHFLKSQHSLGRIMYFDLPGLQSFIIIQPRALVDILRSVITDEIFWPKDPTLNKILRDLTNFGRITKHDLFLLWSQKEFNQYMPNQEIKDFIAKVLVYLDILVEPKRFIKDKAVIAEFYLVPCIVNRSARQMAFDYTTMSDKTICLSYRLIKSNVPSAVSYKLIGALLNIWPVKETSEGICLFHKAAVLSIDGTNELSVLIKEERILVYLTNATSSRLISPDIASVVQECVSFTLEKVMEFYQKSFGKTVSTFDPKSLFEMEVGELCSSKECIIPVDEAQKKTHWMCTNGKDHNTKVCLLWMKRETQSCSSECEGLDKKSLQQNPTDRHLAKLASKIESKKIDEFLLTLGLDSIEWEDIQCDYDGCPASIKRFAGLCECRTKMESESKDLKFQHLAVALDTIEYNKHYLCEVFKENIGLYDSSPAKYQHIPDDTVLDELAKKIGNRTLHLAVELELELSTIEQIKYKNHKDLFGQNRDILFEWKKKGRNKTLLFLMKALQQADPRGLTFLINRSK